MIIIGGEPGGQLRWSELWMRFSARTGTPGAYHYLCQVPGHAQKSMTGTFIGTNFIPG